MKRFVLPLTALLIIPMALVAMDREQEQKTSAASQRQADGYMARRMQEQEPKRQADVEQEPKQHADFRYCLFGNKDEATTDERPHDGLPNVLTNLVGGYLKDDQYTLTHTITRGSDLYEVAASFSRDGSQFVSTPGDRTVKICDATTGTCLQTLTLPAAVESAAFNHDGSRIVAASVFGTTYILDTKTAKFLQTFQGPLCSPAFNHDSSRIVSLTTDPYTSSSNIRVLNARTGESLLSWHSASPLTSAAFNHDGSQIVSGAYDGTITLWDAHSGQHLYTLKENNRQINSVVFNHDGSRLVSTCIDKTVKVWDTRTRKCLCTLTIRGAYANSASFNHDESHIISVSYNGAIQRWSALPINLLDLTTRMRTARKAGLQPQAVRRILDVAADQVDAAIEQEKNKK